MQLIFQLWEYKKNIPMCLHDFWEHEVLLKHYWEQRKVSDCCKNEKDQKPLQTSLSTAISSSSSGEDKDVPKPQTGQSRNLCRVSSVSLNSSLRNPTQMMDHLVGLVLMWKSNGSLRYL